MSDLIVSALLLALAASPLIAQSAPSVHRYRYESMQTVNGARRGGYSTIFRLETDAAGEIDAVIETTGVTDAAGTLTAAEISTSCRVQLHAPPHGIARVRLWPLSLEASRLGPAFLDTCAPESVFFPLTDILNLVLIPNAPRFGADRLTKVGQTIRYPAFTTTFDRLDQHFTETAKGGTLTLVSDEDGVAVLDWSPNPAELQIVRHGEQPVILTGMEHWGFRLQLRSAGGALVSARTTTDDLDLSAHPAGAPADQVFPVAIHREVSISPE